MSTIKTTYIQHPSAASPNLELAADGTVVLPLSGIGDLADVDEGSGAADGDVLTYDGVSSVWFPAAPAGGGFDSVAIITATDASWSVPTLADPIVRVTIFGAGGGGGDPRTGDGSDGGVTTFACSAGTVTADGGLGGRGYQTRKLTSGRAADPFEAGVAGGGAAYYYNPPTYPYFSPEDGRAGNRTTAYLDLTGVTTANVTIGAGGAGGNSAFGYNGGDGGDGFVLFEYRAG